MKAQELKVYTLEQTITRSPKQIIPINESTHEEARTTKQAIVSLFKSPIYEPTEEPLKEKSPKSYFLKWKRYLKKMRS